MNTPRKQVGMVPLSAITAHNNNIRRNLGDLRTLAASIARDGVLVPLVLERRGDRLRIRDGHRRYAAAQMAGLTRVPAIVHSEALEDREWCRQAVVINNHRREQDPTERAETIRRMQAAGMSNREVADAYGVTPQTVRTWLDGGQDKPQRKQPNVPPRRPLGWKQVAAFASEWRARDDATVTDVLDALEALL